MPEGFSADDGMADSGLESMGTAQAAQTPAAAAPGSQDALLGGDVDIITGQRYSAAQVTHPFQHLLSATSCFAVCLCVFHMQS